MNQEPIKTDLRLLCPDCRLPVGELLHPDLAKAINKKTPEDFPKMCECPYKTDRLYSYDEPIKPGYK